MANEALTNADQLYNKVKSLIRDTKPLDESTALIIVESADDAIKEFGNTNQEKKVDLRQWRRRAESVLPPSTIDELRKRAEAQVLKTAYPRTKLLRDVLLWTVGAGIIAATLMAITNVVSETGLKRGDNSGNATTNQQTLSHPQTAGPVDVIGGNRRDNVNAPAPTPAGSVNNPTKRSTPQPPLASNLNPRSLESSATPHHPSTNTYLSVRTPSATPSPSPVKPRQFTEPPRRALMDFVTRKTFTEHSNMLYGRFYNNWSTNPEAAYTAAIEFIQVYPSDAYARYVRRYIKEYERQMSKK